MKLIGQVKLQPNSEQYRQLQDTLERVNEACNWISAWCWDNRTFGKYAIQKAIYQEIRARFGLSAQMTIRAIAKVADSYKLDRTPKRTFKPYGSIAYDPRILSYKPNKREVSILSLEGRLKMSFVAGDKQLELLKDQQGESDLVFRNGAFYLFATCHIDDPEQIDPDGVLGIDLGIVNIATTSDGQTFTGNHVNHVRHRHRRLRKKLQSKGTKSAKRRLKQVSGKESRFAKHTNHVISKQIVETAKDTSRAIAVEKLTGIRDRVTVRRSQRNNLHSWSFHQLKGFIAYKAKRAGIPLIEVDARNTSRLCPVCGCVDKANRRTQSTFSCVACGFSGLADHIAAGNIASRATVSWPHISIATTGGSYKRSTVVVN